MRSTIVILVFLAVTSTVSSAQDLPPGTGSPVGTGSSAGGTVSDVGAGSDLVGRACTACHELDLITAQQHDADGWRVIVDSTISNGAALTPQEEDQVVGYLAKTLPQ